MATFHESFEITTEHRPSFNDVTDKVRQSVERSGIRNGLVVVFSQHTTCTVLIQENSRDFTYNDTLYLFQDLLDILEPIIPKCEKEGQYLHPGPKCIDHSVNVVGETPAETLNTDAHLRSVIMGRSESIPLVNGELQLGEHGNIYFADFDGTRSRTRNVWVQIVGD